MCALTDHKEPVDKNICKKDVVSAAYRVLVNITERWEELPESLRVYSNPKYGAIYTELRNKLRYPKCFQKDIDVEKAKLAATYVHGDEDSVSVKSSTLSDKS